MTTAFCKVCGKKMSQVLHYEEDSNYSYFLCKTCYYTTKPKKIIYDDIDKKETNNIKKYKKSKDIIKNNKKIKKVSRNGHNK